MYSYTSYLTNFIIHIFHILHISYFTYFIFYMFHIWHISYFTFYIFFISYILHIIHFTYYLFYIIHILHISFFASYIFYILYILRKERSSGFREEEGNRKKEIEHRGFEGSWNFMGIIWEDLKGFPGSCACDSLDYLVSPSARCVLTQKKNWGVFYSFFLPLFLS